MKRKIILTILLSAVTAIITGCGGGSEPTDPQVEVVNWSGSELQSITVDGVSFTENLNCFKCDLPLLSNFVSTGKLTVTVEELAAPGTQIDVGLPLGEFREDVLYTVIIRKNSTGYCADLWTHSKPDEGFWEDVTKRFIDSTCTENILFGVWFLDNPEETITRSDNSTTNTTIYLDANIKFDSTKGQYFNDVGWFNNELGREIYVIKDADTFSLTIANKVPDDPDKALFCDFNSLTTGTCSENPDDPTKPLWPFRKMSTVNACQGTWEGVFTEKGTSSPIHTFEFSVDATGNVTWISGTIITTDEKPVVSFSGKLFCDSVSGEAISFLRTNADSPYDQIRIKGVLIAGSPDIISATYETNPPDGTHYNGDVTLTKK